jgi:hypothetical protein
MKSLCLMVAGVCIGCLASTVDWTPSAVGQNTLTDATIPAKRSNSDTARRMSPEKLIIGRWRDRAEPADAVIEMLEDGAGSISNDAPDDSFHVDISWQVGEVYENACLVNVQYKRSKEINAKPLPPEAKPFKMLAVFDGDDRFVFQRGPNDITVMDRQPLKRYPKSEQPPME